MARTIRILCAAALVAFACGGDDLYAPCESADECEAPDGQTAECVDKEGAGFCSWSCSDDGDCEDDSREEDLVCASFEENPDKYCFPACDGEACPDGLSCRSTGGGNENRKVCFP
jgi:hypothetical protein